MKIKYIYGWLLISTLLAFASCTNKADKKQPVAAVPYQNTTLSTVKPVSTIPFAFRRFENNVEPELETVRFSTKASPQIIRDTLMVLKDKNINLKLGENALQVNTKSKVRLEERNRIPTMFSIRFDNDIFDNTDYYYTNGIRLALYTNLASFSPFDKMLIKANGSILLKGFSFTQNMYTPTVPETEQIPYGDYPFSGFLTIGQFLESYNIEKRLTVKSRIELGVLGPASLSGAVQATVHNKEPVGWKYQISNSPVINYSVSVEKGIVSNKNFEWNITAKAEIGTLLDNIQAGTYLRTGKFVPVIRGYDLLLTNHQKKHWQYWFFVKGYTSFVAYNATLQGGMFNDKSPYTISAPNINRALLGASAGIAVYYGNLGVELENIYHSPEFKGAYDFRYGRISLLFGF